MSLHFSPLPEYWSALDDKTKRRVLLVKLQQLNTILPCSKCQALLMKCLPSHSNETESQDAGLDALVALPKPKPKSVAPVGAGRSPLSMAVAPFGLSRLPDGNWMEASTVAEDGGARSSAVRGVSGSSGSAGHRTADMRYAFRPKDGVFEFCGTIDGDAVLRALARDRAPAPAVGSSSSAAGSAGAAPAGAGTKQGAAPAAGRASALSDAPIVGNAVLVLDSTGRVQSVPVAGGGASPGTTGQPGQLDNDKGNGQLVGKKKQQTLASATPASPCWYCRDKIWATFMDMTTYPKPPRKFQLLLHKDDRLRALKRVVSHEAEAGAGASLALVYKSKDMASIRPDGVNATMEQLGVQTGGLILITRQRARTPSPSATGEGGEAVAPGVGQPVPPDAPAVWVDGQGEGGPTAAPVPNATASQPVHSAASNAATVASVLRITAGAQPRLGKSEGAGEGRGRSNKTSVLASSSTAELLDQLLHGTAAPKGQDTDGQDGAEEEAVGSGGMAVPSSKGSGPVASVERRHGFTLLGSMLSVAAAANIVSAWRAEADALALQAALIQEEEEESSKKAAKEKGKGKDKGKGKEKVPVSAAAAAPAPVPAPKPAPVPATQAPSKAATEPGTKAQSTAKAQPAPAASMPVEQLDWSDLGPGDGEEDVGDEQWVTTGHAQGKKAKGQAGAKGKADRPATAATSKDKAHEPPVSTSAAPSVASSPAGTPRKDKDKGRDKRQAAGATTGGSAAAGPGPLAAQTPAATTAAPPQAAAKPIAASAPVPAPAAAPVPPPALTASPPKGKAPASATGTGAAAPAASGGTATAGAAAPVAPAATTAAKTAAKPQQAVQAGQQAKQGKAVPAPAPAAAPAAAAAAAQAPAPAPPSSSAVSSSAAVPEKAVSTPARPTAAVEAPKAGAVQQPVQAKAAPPAAAQGPPSVPAQAPAAVSAPAPHFCHDCGTTLPSVAKFCPNCGTRVAGAPAPGAGQAVLPSSLGMSDPTLVGLLGPVLQQAGLGQGPTAAAPGPLDPVATLRSLLASVGQPGGLAGVGGRALAAMDMNSIEALLGRPGQGQAMQAQAAAMDAAFASPGPGQMPSQGGPMYGQPFPGQLQQPQQQGQMLPNGPMPTGGAWPGGASFGQLDGLAMLGQAGQGMGRDAGVPFGQGAAAGFPGQADGLAMGQGRAPSPDVLQGLSIGGLQSLSGLLSGLGLGSGLGPMDGAQAGPAPVGVPGQAAASLHANPNALNPEAGEYHPPGHPPGHAQDGQAGYGPGEAGSPGQSRASGMAAQAPRPPATQTTPIAGTRRLPVFATLDYS